MRSVYNRFAFHKLPKLASVYRLVDQPRNFFGKSDSGLKKRRRKRRKQKIELTFFRKDEKTLGCGVTLGANLVFVNVESRFN